MTATSTHAHEVKAKDSERQRIAKQLEEWRAAGGIPEIVTTCRQEKTIASLSEKAAATWEDKR